MVERPPKEPGLSTRLQRDSSYLFAEAEGCTLCRVFRLLYSAGTRLSGFCKRMDASEIGVEGCLGQPRWARGIRLGAYGRILSCDRGLATLSAYGGLCRLTDPSHDNFRPSAQAVGTRR